MSFSFFLKGTTTAGEIPTTAQIGLNELFVNTADGILYMAKQPSGQPVSIVAVGSGSSGSSSSGSGSGSGSGAYLPTSGGTVTGIVNLQGGVEITQNMAGVLPSINTAGLTAGWNYTNGKGEVALFNTYVSATSSFVLSQMLSSTVSRTLMTVQASGNVGLGVTAPTARLHVSGGAIIDSLTLTGGLAANVTGNLTGNVAASSIVVSAAVTGDFGAANDIAQMSVVNPTTSGGNALISFTATNQLSTKIGLSPSLGFVIGGWSLPTNALMLNSAGLLTVATGITTGTLTASSLVVPLIDGGLYDNGTGGNATGSASVVNFSLTPVTTIAASGTAQSISFPLSGTNIAYDMTLTANCTLTVSGGLAGYEQVATLYIHAGTGGFGCTFPSAVVTASGSAITVNSTAGKTTIVVLATHDASATIYQHI